MIGKKNTMLSRRNSAKNWLKTTFRQLEEEHKEEEELEPMASKQLKERREEAKEQMLVAQEKEVRHLHGGRYWLFHLAHSSVTKSPW